MNWSMAREVGPLTYILKRLLWRWWQRRGQPEVRYNLPGGQTVILPFKASFASDIYCTGGHVDWGSEQLLLQYLRQTSKGVCYDVGANMGYYSLLLSSVATEVVAFEPDPRNHAHLLGQHISNLTLVPQAVSDSCGTASFDNSDASTVGHLLLDSSTPSQFTVETTTLDHYRQSHPTAAPVSAVKMDVEGYEILGLQGATELTQKDQPVYLIEYSMGGGAPNSVAGLNSFLTRHDYSLYAMTRRPVKPWRYHTDLQKLQPEDITVLDLKMLFLVPPGDRFFHQQCQQGYCFETIRQSQSRAA